MSIGQGVVQMTPLELATMVSAIANGGKLVKPHLLASQTYQPNMQPESLNIDPKVLKVVQSGLEAVVKEGTGRQLADGSIPLTAGKTGTAEVLGQRDNAMYVAYGPANDPQIAIAVAVENGGYGAESAVPIAHEIFKAYFGSPKVAPKPAS
jgi:penicillin-binding protein 2